MAARAAAPTAGVVHSYARGVFRDGHSERFGQPHALIQLYERGLTEQPGRWVLPQGMRSLYVALTRATKRLTIAHAEPLPEVLVD